MTGLARIETEQRGTTCFIRASGEVDISNAAELLTAIEMEMPHETQELVLDLSAVSYVDSAGVALLLRLATRLQGRRLKMALVAPAGGPVRAVLDVAGVSGMLPVVDPPGGEG